MRQIRLRQGRRLRFRLLPVCPAMALAALAAASAATAEGGASLATIRGFDYGPFRQGQSPSAGIFPSAAELQQDLQILAPHTKYVRFYSEANGFQNVIPAATALGLTVIPGAFLSTDSNANSVETASLVQAVKNAGATANFPLVVVGSEAISQQGLSADQLIAQINQVRAAIGGAFRIATAETPSVWINTPSLAAAVDVILVDIYPYYSGASVADAPAAVIAVIANIQSQYPDRAVMIGETGWPSRGATIGAAVPSRRNQQTYALAILTETLRQQIGVLYFEAFDEAWKIDATTPPALAEGHFGLYRQRRDTAGIPKGRVQNTFPPFTAAR